MDPSKKGRLGILHALRAASRNIWLAGMFPFRSPHYEYLPEIVTLPAKYISEAHIFIPEPGGPRSHLPVTFQSDCKERFCDLSCSQKSDFLRTTQKWTNIFLDSRKFTINIDIKDNFY